MPPLTYDSVTPEAESVSVEAKGRTLSVSFPLTVTLGATDVYCETAEGYEVWYFHEQEFAEHADNIPRFVAEALTNPVATAHDSAPHLISSAMETDPDALDQP